MAHSLDPMLPDSGVSVQKKKATRLHKDEAIPSNAEAKSEKKLQKRVKQLVDDENEVDGNDCMAKEKTKRKRETDATEAFSDADGTNKDSRKKKKKRSKGAEGNKEPEADTSTSFSEKKKRKNKTGFQDPNEDASLLEQAQKSLAYAFLQFHRPSKWKFNKARQNWLIRNIWSAEAIPEPYLPLVMGYLAKVQGGVRENLMQSCRTALEPPKTDVRQTLLSTTDESASAPVPLISLQDDETKQSRAQALLDILISS